MEVYELIKDNDFRRDIFRSEEYLEINPNIAVPDAIKTDKEINNIYTTIAPLFGRQDKDKKRTWLYIILANSVKALEQNKYILSFTRQGTIEFPSVFIKDIEYLVATGYLIDNYGKKGKFKGRHKSRAVITDKLADILFKKLTLFYPKNLPDTKCYIKADSGEKIEDISAPALVVQKEINEHNFCTESKLRYLKHFKPAPNQKVKYEPYYRWMPVKPAFYDIAPCGRSVGAHIQTISKLERMSVIDNKTNQFVIELDINACHPRIIYNNLCGIPMEFDPYDLFDDGNKHVIKVAKAGMMNLINCEEGKKHKYAGVYRAFHNALNLNKKYNKQYNCMDDKTASEIEDAVELNRHFKFAGLSVKEIIQLLVKRNHRIAHYFCKGIVHKVFWIEGNFCRDAMNNMNLNNIFNQSIHDSFQILRQDEHPARFIINESWERFNNGFPAKMKKTDILEPRYVG